MLSHDLEVMGLKPVLLNLKKKGGGGGGDPCVFVSFGGRECLILVS